MKFLLDESADQRLITFLADQGHDVTAVARDHPNALSDRDVLSLARRERRVLITNDKDFGDLIVRESLRHAGVVLFRLRTTRLSVKRDRLQHVLSRYPRRLRDFLVVTEGRVRSR